MRLQNPFQPSSLISIFTVLLSMLIAACAPTANKNLERARSDYQQAANDPTVRENASADLFAAEKTLQRAEDAWEEDDDSDEVDHLSYLASRKVDLARVTASEVESKKAFEELSAQKDQVRLQARDAEIARLKAKKVPQGILVTLGDVLFDTGRSNLKAGSLQNIYPLVEYLKTHGETMVKIEGHTDSRGSSEYNINLSEMRAESVRSFLINSGISPQRISARGMGEDYPVATNSSASGRQQNRRVEVTITDAPQTMTPPSSGGGM
jgi:outer membrane protein OmpA-like peptidoglycan-associated protein